MHEDILAATMMTEDMAMTMMEVTTSTMTMKTGAWVGFQCHSSLRSRIHNRRPSRPLNTAKLTMTTMTWRNRQWQKQRLHYGALSKERKYPSPTFSAFTQCFLLAIVIMINKVVLCLPRFSPAVHAIIRWEQFFFGACQDREDRDGY